MWILYSIGAATIFVVMTLSWKQLFNLGIPAEVQLFLNAVFMMVFFYGHVLFTKQPLKMSGVAFAILVLSGLLGYAGNTLQLWAFSKAPNPGYVVAIVSTQALFVTILAVLIFGSDFSLIKGVGVLFCVTGAVLLSL